MKKQDKPMVVAIDVRGGVADVTLFRKRQDVEIIHIDWDNLKETTDPEEVKEAILQAQRLPTGEYRKNTLADLRDILAGIEEPKPQLRPSTYPPHRLSDYEEHR